MTLQPSDVSTFNSFVERYSFLEQNIPSQIWFFETFEPLAPAMFHTTRQLVSGNYILENCHSQQYLSISQDDFVVATSDEKEATHVTSRFILKKILY